MDEIATAKWGVLDNLSWSRRQCESPAEVALVAAISERAVGAAKYGVRYQGHGVGSPWWHRIGAWVAPVPFPVFRVPIAKQVISGRVEAEFEPTTVEDSDAPLWSYDVATEILARETWGLNVPFCADHELPEDLALLMSEYAQSDRCEYRRSECTRVPGSLWKRVGPVRELTDPHCARLLVLLCMLKLVRTTTSGETLCGEQVKFVQAQLSRPTQMSVDLLVAVDGQHTMWDQLALRTLDALDSRAQLGRDRVVQLPNDVTRRWRALRPFWDAYEESWCCHEQGCESDHMFPSALDAWNTRQIGPLTLQLLQARGSSSVVMR